jgi:hypothetical protein
LIELILLILNGGVSVQTILLARHQGAIEFEQAAADPPAEARCHPMELDAVRDRHAR